MKNRITLCVLLLLTVVSANTYAQSGQLKACRTTSRSVVVQPSRKPMRLAGSLLNEGKHEYRLTVRSNLRVDVKLKTDSQLKLDIYTLKPPAKLKTKVLDWSDELSRDKEYALVVSNCYSSTPGNYQIEITTR
jgi:hypothetical protein